MVSKHLAVDMQRLRLHDSFLLIPDSEFTRVAFRYAGFVNTGANSDFAEEI